jgi:hypothetical protein
MLIKKEISGFGITSKNTLKKTGKKVVHIVHSPTQAAHNRNALSIFRRKRELCLGLSLENQYEACYGETQSPKVCTSRKEPTDRARQADWLYYSFSNFGQQSGDKIHLLVSTS